MRSRWATADSSRPRYHSVQGGHTIVRKLAEFALIRANEGRGVLDVRQVALSSDQSTFFCRGVFLQTGVWIRWGGSRCSCGRFHCLQRGDKRAEAIDPSMCHRQNKFLRGGLDLPDSRTPFGSRSKEIDRTVYIVRSLINTWHKARHWVVSIFSSYCGMNHRLRVKWILRDFILAFGLLAFIGVSNSHALCTMEVGELYSHTIIAWIYLGSICRKSEAADLDRDQTEPHQGNWYHISKSLLSPFGKKETMSSFQKKKAITGLLT